MKTSLAGEERTIDAVVRNLEIIGEAVKQLPPGATSKRRLDADRRFILNGAATVPAGGTLTVAPGAV